VYAWNSTSKKYIQRGTDIDGEAAGDRSGTSVSLCRLVLHTTMARMALILDMFVCMLGVIEINA
jgi:hypothetical protein